MTAKDCPDRKAKSSMGIISFVLGLVGGTGSSIITKVLFTMQAEGLNEHMKAFEVSIASGEGVTNWDASCLCQFLITFLYCVSPT